jgi:hypothetical protein
MVVTSGDRPRRGWRNVHRGDPCEICGKGDWCSRSVDRAWVVCRRVDGGGERRLDRAGAEYWLHALGLSSRPAPAVPDPPTRERACSADLDRVYSALLRHLRLESSHRDALCARGLDEQAIEAGGYRSLPQRERARIAAELAGLFDESLLLTIPGFHTRDGTRKTYLSFGGPAGLVVPVRDAQGRIVALKIRRDDPGDGPKYLYVSSTASGGPGPGAPVHVPLHEPSRGPVGAVRVTEGELKADAATHLSGLLTISVPGVSAWRGALAVLAGMAPSCVQLAFDADAAVNPLVAKAAEATAVAMTHEGYEVVLELWDGMLAKGVDDALIRGVHIHRAHPPLAPPHQVELTGDVGRQPDARPYHSTPAGLVWRRQTASGPVNMPLTNFSALIAAEVLEDDGAEVRRRFEVEARLNGACRRFTVGAEAFASMGWVMEHLGARAILYPGFGLRDHARAAIQVLSGDVREHHVYAHTGWRKVAGGWAYLHAGGAVGAAGAGSGVQVALPEALSGFNIPDPPSGVELARAVKASLGILETAPDHVTVPMLAAVYRAVLGNTDFSVHLAGPTGAGKTELASLAQRHFGMGMDARHLPGSWASTANALEGLAFIAKDAVLVVDDFAPGTESKDTERAHRDADRVLRAQGNRSGRLRMRSDSTLQVSRPPRGLILSTGEDLPKGQSLRGRLLVCELGPTDVNWDCLTACQHLAASGVFAHALSGFLVWIAERYEAVQASLRQASLSLRAPAAASHAHPRTPEIVANLAAGLGLFLDFGRAVGVLTETDQRRLWARAWSALLEASRMQGEHQTAGDPAQRFLDLLQSVIASGRAHLAAPDGNRPIGDEPWGWRRGLRGTLEPKGERIGWVDGDQVYLDPDAAYAAVQRLGDEVGDRLGLTPQTLRRRLKEHGALASSESQRRMLTVRRTLDGSRREVLHLRRATLSCLLDGGPDGGLDGGEDRGRSACPDGLVGLRSARATNETGRLPALIPPLVGLVGISAEEREPL